MEKAIQTIDEYLTTFSENKKSIMQNIREIILEEAPDAIEKISRQMPTFTLKGNLIHFAGHKNHIGIYPGPEVMEIMKEHFKDYKTSKGAIQFPFNQKISYDLIKEIVKCAIIVNKR